MMFFRSYLFWSKSSTGLTDFIVFFKNKCINMPQFMVGQSNGLQIQHLLHILSSSLIFSVSGGKPNV